MSMKQILETVRGFEGVVELAPEVGSEFPEVAWGDHFFYYAPDGQVPQRGQPFATIVTKDYPGDTESELDPPDRWRLNIHVGRASFTELTGEEPRATESAVDFSAADTVLPHPVYRAQGWIAIVNPGARTSGIAGDLLRRAHDDARRRKTPQSRDSHG
ncbi:hypothetical protein HCA61_04140 [Rhodococcus sp. HNM0563]|uniref:DUF6194 family protein n=1 Tax=unclassified Rhodococcus (in: high G+C Gram-positive bacteria) TaxID=192944 RepID=UPI00146E9162|nr:MULTISPECIES: DUF6194 family protein [unclassified Rhodococcus (in: high G+C Gram-positive bacteria)]MCK0090243.1 DUF6194 family protein [Rhodococcus sp. F64268]NLU61451.1 hypothetical protein [Rhodococcus sp. HNM0563]